MPTDNWSSWSTHDELMALDFMVSDSKRGADRKRITNIEKIRRLRGWMKHALTRDWQGVDGLECIAHCRQLLTKLGAEHV